MDTTPLPPAASPATPPVTSEPEPAAPVPVAVLARTSTMALQDPLSSLRRQFRLCEEWLPAGWYVAAWYWDVESGAIDLEDRSLTTSHEPFTAAGLPRDGGMADLLAEAAAPEPRFSAVICEDIERSGRDTFNALKLERELSDQGVPLFATDEPASVQEVSPTTVLVRRVKQGVAEYTRLQIRKKAWGGLQQHTIEGWNIGPAPYGYVPVRIKHPAPLKAAQGRTKTRLALDLDRSKVVARIYRWRVEDHLGIPTITARLNADHGTYPPPDGQNWDKGTVAHILANPKYTGHMVYGRRRTKPGQRTPAGRRKFRRAQPSEWTWSDETHHPAIITRAMFDAAQTIAQQHRTATDDPNATPQPQARRSYPLRSRVRCRICQRRMRGVTRRSTAYYAGDPAASYTYYQCTHDPSHPRHTAAHPDHPNTVSIRQDTLTTLIRDFFDTRVFGPDRRELLETQIPATAAQAAEQRTRQHDRLTKELARIDLAQRSQILQIDTLSADPADTAAQAMRTRCSERFTELHHERQAIQAQLDTLATQPDPTGAADLLDNLPLLIDTIDLHPDHIQAALYQAFDIQAIYNTEDHQVSIYATITTSTPRAVAAILTDAHNDPTLTTTTPVPPSPDTPEPQASNPAVSPLTERPMACLPAHRRATWKGSGAAARKDIELVALGVGQRHPAELGPVVVHHRGTERDEPRDLFVLLPVGWVDVDVEPVLDGLALGHVRESQRWWHRARVVLAFRHCRRANRDNSVVFVLHLVVKDRAPEPGETAGIGTVDRKLGELTSHVRISQSAAVRQRPHPNHSVRRRSNPRVVCVHPFAAPDLTRGGQGVLLDHLAG
jgi:site-specific DNA recombinase